MCNKKCESCKVQCKKSKLRKGGYPMVEAISEVKKDIKRKEKIDRKVKNKMKKMTTEKHTKNIKTLNYGKYTILIDEEVKKPNYNDEKLKISNIFKDHKYAQVDDEIVVLSEYAIENNLSEEDIYTSSNIKLFPYLKKKRKVTIISNDGTQSEDLEIKIKYKRFKKIIEQSSISLVFNLNDNSEAFTNSELGLISGIRKYSYKLNNNIYESIDDIIKLVNYHTKGVWYYIEFAGKKLSIDNLLEYIGIRK